MPIQMYENVKHLEGELSILFEDYITTFREMEKHVKPEMLEYFKKRRNELLPSGGMVRRDVT